MAYLVLTIDDEQLETVWTQVKNINGVDDTALLEEITREVWRNK